MSTVHTEVFRKAIKGAVAKLGHSGRGQQTLKDFRTMLRNGATSLDKKNMTALCILVESVRTGFVGSVMDELSTALERGQQ